VTNAELACVESAELPFHGVEGNGRVTGFGLPILSFAQVQFVNRGSFFKLNLTQSRYLPLVRKRKVCFASMLCKLLTTRQLSEIAVPLESIRMKTADVF